MTTSLMHSPSTVRPTESIICAFTYLVKVETTSSVFQIRPFKEFVAAKGRDRLLALNRFNSFLPDETELPPSSEDASSSSHPRNAYDFMKARRDATGDPTTRRWNASIRLANFTAVESSPLCVSDPAQSTGSNA